jgi:hypothetical protein
MGQIIASGNPKGGTGKTAIAVNLAWALATRGLEVVLLDIDPQGSACEWAQSGFLPIRVEAAPPINVTGGGRWLARAASWPTRSMPWSSTCRPRSCQRAPRR